MDFKKLDCQKLITYGILLLIGVYFLRDILELDFRIPILEGQANQEDTAVEEDGATVVIDAMSFQYLMGSELDYMEGLEGSRFVVNNPNATTTCGCGASFSI